MPTQACAGQCAPTLQLRRGVRRIRQPAPGVAAALLPTAAALICLVSVPRSAAVLWTACSGARAVLVRSAITPLALISPGSAALFRQIVHSVLERDGSRIQVTCAVLSRTGGLA